MPSSKRNKLVTLSKVKKKTKEWKGGLIVNAHKLLAEYPSLYLFQYQNMRNDKFKELREQVQATSRFCMGSNKVLKVALGKTERDEQKQNLHLVSDRIKGDVGLFFTTLPQPAVKELFGTFQVSDYARAGSKATQDFDIPEGLVEGPRGPMAHTLEPTLRKHGVPTKLNKGVVECTSDHKVCSIGERLTADQAAILRMFDLKTVEFKMQLLTAWTEEGKFEVLREAHDEDANSDDEEMVP